MLDRKLRRDLAHLAGQCAAIALVIACGVMTFIISMSSLDILSLTKERFYQSQHFAQVFVNLKRAPLGLAERIGRLPGVNQVEARVATAVHLEVPDYDDMVRGQLISIPDGRQPQLNRLYVRAGQLPEAGRNNQVAISEAFAEAHGLQPGNTLQAVINGHLQTLIISGIVLSPEFVYQIGPADLLPDYERYGVLWMNREGVARATGMDGAFNDLLLTLQAGVSADDVMLELDRLLIPYGSQGAYTRDDQLSHRFLQQELDQLRAMAIVMPVIFLGVAAFLLNVVVGRMIRQQREQIAVLKAFGYTDSAIARHYLAMVGLIVLAGSLVGVAAGSWLANGLAVLYAEYFRFPELAYRLEVRVMIMGVGIAALAAFIGTLSAVHHAVSLPPAEAMRPPAPDKFHRGVLERVFPAGWLDAASRMLIRNLSRHPIKAGLSVTGIALAGALLVLGNYQFAAVDYMIDVQYDLSQRMDMHVSFSEPTPTKALGELRHLPGVSYAEGYRATPVRLRAGHRHYRTSITGLPEEPVLRRILNENLQPISLPAEGLLLTQHLADYLQVGGGDSVRVEIMEGHRRTLDVPVAGTVQELIGVGAYAHRDWLNRILREGPALSGAWLMVDSEYQQILQSRLRELPQIAGVGMIMEAATSLREHMDETILLFVLINLLLAGSIAFAVVYNNARIAFAERARELATMRVMGFSKAEIGWILIGEIGLLTLLALPLGWTIGAGFCWLMTIAMSSDLFRIPLVLTTASFAFSALGILLATGLSLLLVGRQLNRLDILSALKTIE